MISYYIIYKYIISFFLRRFAQIIVRIMAPGRNSEPHERSKDSGVDLMSRGRVLRH